MNNQINDCYTNGQPIDWEMIFKTYRMPLVIKIRNDLGDEEVAKDLASEAFAAALNSRKRFTEPDHIKATLLATAIRLVANYVRDMATRKRCLAAMPMVERKPPQLYEHHWGTMAAILEQVDNIINSFPPGQKEIIRLRYYDGIRSIQIAEQLGLSIHTINNVVRTVKAKLQKEVGHLPYFDCLDKE
jgi:RNA polymerase sigma-70 factor (ECF subfamily)